MVLSSKTTLPKLSKSRLNVNCFKFSFSGHPPADEEDAVGHASGMVDDPRPPFHQIVGLAPETVVAPRAFEHECDDAGLPQSFPLKIVFSYPILSDYCPTSFGRQCLDPLMVRRVGGKLVAEVDDAVAFRCREGVESGGQMGRQVVVEKEFQTQAAAFRSKLIAARTAGLGTSYQLDTLSTEPSTSKAANSTSVGTP